MVEHAYIYFVFAWCFAMGVVAADDVRWLASRAYRPLRCRLGLCPGKVSTTDEGIGWLCRDCGAIKHWESWERIKKELDHDDGR